MGSQTDAAISATVTEFTAGRHGAGLPAAPVHDRSPYASDRVVIATTPWIRTDTRKLSEAAELLVLDDKRAPFQRQPGWVP